MPSLKKNTTGTNYEQATWALNIIVHIWSPNKHEIGHCQ